MAKHILVTNDDGVLAPDLLALTHKILLNVNVPFLADNKIRGVVLTRQGLRVYHSRLDERMDPRSKPYYWIGGDPPPESPNAAQMSARWRRVSFPSRRFSSISLPIALYLI